MKLTQTQKAAVILMALGESLAAQVLQYLSPKEVQILGNEMVSLPPIDNDALGEILDAYLDEAKQHVVLSSVDARDYLRSILTKSMGEEKAATLLDELFNEDRSSLNRLDMLNHMDAVAVADLIKNENPQIIATILVYINRDLAADILSLFKDELRNDIVLRIAKFGVIQPEALQELTQILCHLLDEKKVKHNKMGGIRTAAEIVNLMKNQQEESVMEAVRHHDANLAEQIMGEMFSFEDFINIDDSSMRRLLKELDNETLVIALKKGDPALCDKFFKNMPQRASAILRDEINNRPSVRLSQVEAEQKTILSVARRLANAGEMILRGEEDKYV